MLLFEKNDKEMNKELLMTHEYTAILLFAVAVVVCLF